MDKNESNENNYDLDTDLKKTFVEKLARQPILMDDYYDPSALPVKLDAEPLSYKEIINGCNRKEWY